MCPLGGEFFYSPVFFRLLRAHALTVVGFLRQISHLIRPHRSRFFAAVLAGFGFAAGTGLLAVAVGIVCDAIFPQAGVSSLADKVKALPAFLRDPAARWLAAHQLDPKSPTMTGIILMIPVAMLFRGFGGYLTSYWANWVGAKVVHDLRCRLFAHLQGLSLDFFSVSRTGDLMSRVVNDTQALQSLIANALGTLVRDPVTILLLSSYLIFQQPRLTLVSLVVFPVVVVPVFLFGRKVRKTWRTAQKHTSELSDVMQETFSAARVVKAYNLEPAVIGRFATTSDKLARQLLRFVRASEFPGPLIEFFGSVGAALLLLYVAKMDPAQRPSNGDFNSFLGSLFMLYQPIKSLTRLYGQVEQGRAILERSEELLDARSTVVDPLVPRPVTVAGATVEFDHVFFRYGDHPVLQDFHLTLKPGQFVALVGATGSGKTTVTSLLLRFQDPERGTVRIGGVDIREFCGSDLRDQIAVVTQETMLFNDTLRANLRIGRAGATDSEIEEAARLAHAEEFILGRPEGYDALIGERGVALSGGQRQRLALARALLRKAAILILDEATSALDTETERAVQEALDAGRKDRITLCIAHRLSTVQSADWIVVLDSGRIVQEGTHADLLVRGGHYRRLYELQFSV